MSFPTPYPVQVHSYLPTPSTAIHQPPSRPVQTYEHLPASPSPSQQTPVPQNAVVFIGGLGDGPHTIPYVRTLAQHLTSSNPSYSVFEARLSSAFSAFGYSSLAQDAREIADLVRYLRKGLGRKRVVLMGHSTGCQDCLEYGSKYLQLGKPGLGAEEEGEARVDGLVLQGPVSDREAIGMTEDQGEVRACLEIAQRMVAEGKGAEVMRREEMPAGWRGSPVTAYRWCSLAGVGGDDDYFSSDLPDQKVADIWGKLEQPVLILPSEKDEWVSKEIDVFGLVNRWKSFCRPGIASELSGLIPAANHRVDDAAAQKWLAERVAGFLAEIEKR
ncbi:hypothetical protein MMYC01_203134 [Madurella mycetomatis]|uniref:Uncharacterized protein n=1 Tax=Madurella mycetomatis TaxID=100816 RepID=A0A175W7R7_9PEZI|nr:hypothetical protein MMYC01_203134 [Madurella mycetomatis]